MMHKQGDNDENLETLLQLNGEVFPMDKRYGARKITWDHKHHVEKVLPYEYESAGQLLEDFWVAVDKITQA